MLQLLCSIYIVIVTKLVGYMPQVIVTVMYVCMEVIGTTIANVWTGQLRNALPSFSKCTNINYA